MIALTTLSNLKIDNSNEIPSSIQEKYNTHDIVSDVKYK